MNFLALGDSYTIGEGVAANERWPALLAAALDLEPPQIVARTGWTTDELSTAIDQADLHPPYALVTLLIGVNNQYRGRDTGEYRSEFAELLDRAIDLAEQPSRVVVISIPDWGVTKFASGRDARAIGADIDRFNSINREETERRRARYADITAISRQAASDPSLTTSDDLHPSAAMYRRWLDVILPVARKALAAR